jgi:uracil-DNA glycosylase
MNGWENHIPLIRDGYAGKLLDTVTELRGKSRIFPPRDRIFNALERVAFDRVRVVILGQDPYHGPGQAHGLSFSVPEGIPAPPSLRNILKEVADDTGSPLPHPLKTDLTPWADQGVLLLNTLLTVEEGKPLSHRKLGWETLTDQIVRELARQREHLVFMLWGAHAQSKRPLIPENRHLVLIAAHPSPLSAYRGFFGCRHFTLANDYLSSNGIPPIRW